MSTIQFPGFDIKYSENGIRFQKFTGIFYVHRAYKNEDGIHIDKYKKSDVIRHVKLEFPKEVKQGLLYLFFTYCPKNCTHSIQKNLGQIKWD